MFQTGEDTGSTPGEYHLWVQREHLDQVFPLPAGNHNVRMNKDGVLGMLTGVATAKAAASVMALGLDPRFDLTKAYWVIAGIGGGDPADVSLGSAVWANHVLDGDLGYEIDAREIPKDWPTGFVPMHKSTPYEQPVNSELEGEVYTLNQDLVAWAYGLTKDIPLADSGRDARGARQVCRLSERHEAAVCDPGRHDVQQHLLARYAHESMGQRMDQVLHWRQRELHDFGDGGFRNLAGAHVSRSGAPCGPETCPGVAYGKQL